MIRTTCSVGRFESLECRRLLAAAIPDALLAEPLGQAVWGDVVAASRAARDDAPAIDIGLLPTDGPASHYYARQPIRRGNLRQDYRFELPARARLDVIVLLGPVTSELSIWHVDGPLIARRYGKAASYIRFGSDLPRGRYRMELVGRAARTIPYHLAIAAQSARPPGQPPQEPPASSPANASLPTVALPIPLPDIGSSDASVGWNVERVGAIESWAAGYRGQGVVVALIDTGVDTFHPDLKGRLWRNADEVPGDGLDNDSNGYVDDLLGWNFLTQSGQLNDPNGHGTHIAGILAAADDGLGVTGVAPDARLMVLQVLDAQKKGKASRVAEAIRYAVDEGARVINLSLSFDHPIASVERALRYAGEHDVLVVVAAGNEGQSTAIYPAQYSRNLENVIAVGAHDRSDRRATFSNRVGTSGVVQVDAPGVGIRSTQPDGSYATWFGTSMATPHVSGVAALASSAYPHLPVRLLRTAIVQLANRPIAGSDSRGGVNAAATVPLVANIARQLPAESVDAAFAGGTSPYLP